MRTHCNRGVAKLGVLAAALMVSAAGQGTRDAQPSDQSQVAFRATAELVQFDAVVLDAARHPVTTLTLDDFEVRQDGSPMVLRDVVFIDRASRHAARVIGGADPTSVPRVGIDVEPLIFLVDDMVMSPDGFDRVKAALRQFVDMGLPAGFEIGILRTGETGRRTTALTADAGELRRRIDELRYMARSVRGGLARSGAVSAGHRDIERTFVDGTLGSLNSLLVSLRSLPGRKTVVIFSEGIALRVDEEGLFGQPVEARLDRLAQLAAEASVTTHTIDVTGVNGALSGPQRLNDRMLLRDGLDNLARRMAGLYLFNTNDLIEPLRRIVAVEQGYYLLSYAPPDGTFVSERTAPFRKLSVTVREPGLVVRTRAGFFGRRSAD